jgi:hypothetical protein
MQVSNEPLAQPMRQIAAQFARAMQSKMQTTGHFFERRFHAVLVDIDTYLKAVVRYIHLNPLEARLVADPAEYPWSSHRAYLGAPHEPWLFTDLVMQQFASTRERAIVAYRQFVNCPDGETGAAWPVGESGTHGPGNDEFIARAQKVPPAARSRQSLAELIAEACRRFETDLAALTSPLRNDYQTKVRAWIAHQARIRYVASLADVARALNRHEATLRQAIRRYPDEIK